MRMDGQRKTIPNTYTSYTYTNIYTDILEFLSELEDKNNLNGTVDEILKLVISQDLSALCLRMQIYH